ncbi:MAG: DDE-type integrase/transposase/recombinase [Ktedonobacteraceae bacterium]|nr:DDE-type integrase/transposase/recombinase [Ktedonobacteraceae bacterium]
MVCPVASLSPHARREVVDRMASCYQEASVSEKGLLLDTLVEISGYTRKYAIGLLNQPSRRTRPVMRPHPSSYGHEVQEALLFAWKASDRICTKRLIPFLPTLIASLERHGYLHLSAATADRLLQMHRNETPRGLSTTKAGRLLKGQIPLRTFREWDDAQPGFVEADLVAHCAGQAEGGFLSTLTLTDVATGWTECLPLLYRSSDAVMMALDQARTLFPFPILGIDTDNGSEFINKEIVAYCQREQLTFTRGRPDLKNDQCFVEQKNGAIVRHFAGYERLVGQQVYHQLREVYRAVRLYVNCF